MRNHDAPHPASQGAGHRVDWIRIAMLERELYGETFHHISAPACHCDECVQRRIDWGNELHKQTASGWHAELIPHHDPIWILPPPRHPDPQL